ncbi:MAG: asparagine synthase (glutamine-hydrolyzing), partial [Planctomycetes bacterium]|nr:asparagine synthase (glutamine-hydrolyzing) [Planctomycetota bacterium]
MCGIAGYVTIGSAPRSVPQDALRIMSRLQRHRGPDGSGVWSSQNSRVGLIHRRLAIIDLSDQAAQPMSGLSGSTLTYNGEIYNYRELRSQLESYGVRFRSQSDTETLLALYERAGVDCVNQLRGMFAFALWDERKQRLFLARDRFGIKPLYYTCQDNIFYFASEQKALLPFLPSIRTNPSALAEYLTFQYTISGSTMFDGIEQLMPGHYITIQDGNVQVTKYWDIKYEVDYSWTAESAEEHLRDLLSDSVDLHLRSDVEVGSYLSGGVDSSLMAILASSHAGFGGKGFHGRFIDYPGYDESGYARKAADVFNGDLRTIDITADDFQRHIRSVIWHLDQPTAGPGSFPQFMVSALAAKDVKVVLGGQGGDEIFGGYARYLIAYLEQCIKAAIDGTYQNGNYVVTIESIVPNLGTLREYKPLIMEFWKDGLFGSLDERFFRLVDRSTDMQSEILWDELDLASVRDSFFQIFNNQANVRKEAYFDSMTHFECKTLLPALLVVEDRMSMAHGLESRVPLLDHPLVEFAATVPADLKFPGGRLKHLLRNAYRDILPQEINERRDKMGFPVPL